MDPDGFFVTRLFFQKHMFCPTTLKLPSQGFVDESHPLADALSKRPLQPAICASLPLPHSLEQQAC